MLLRDLKLISWLKGMIILVIPHFVHPKTISKLKIHASIELRTLIAEFYSSKLANLELVPTSPTRLKTVTEISKEIT